MTHNKKARLPLGRRARFFAGGLGILLLLTGGILWASAGRNTRYELSSFSMGSYVQQTLWGAKSEQTAADVSAALNDLENRISWRREGDIAQINRQAGKEPVLVEEDTLALLEEMLALCEKSGGALDITLGPVTRLWDFDNEPRLPGGDELEAALKLVGCDRLLTGGDAFFAFAAVSRELFDGDASALEQAAALLDPGMSIDLGAVGKGAACDTALKEYRRAGIKGAVVAVGGSIGLYGEKPDGKPFRVSVRDPAGAGSLGVLELSGGFVSTSGSYEKFFEQDGKTYCHLLDPRTGYPAESGLVSVTVWCEDSGALSDGLATACFVLGPEKGLALLAEYGAEGVLVDDGHKVAVTAGLKERFSLTAQDYALEDGS